MSTRVGAPSPSAGLGGSPGGGAPALGNFVALATGQGVAGVLSLVTLTVLANRLQPTAYGRICFAEAVLSYCLVLANLGLDLVGIRRVAQRPGSEREVAGELASLRLALGLGVFALLGLFSAIVDAPPQTRRLLLLYGPTLLAVALSLDWVFQGVQRMQWCGAALVLREAVFMGLCVSFVRGPEQVLLVPLWYLASRAVGSLLLGAIFVRDFGRFALLGRPTRWREILGEAAPVGLSQILGLAMYVAGTLFLGMQDRAVEVGLLNAATRPLSALLILASAYSSAVYPSFAAAFARSQQHLVGLVGTSGRWAALAGLLAAGAGTLLGGWVIGLLYPDGSYAASAGVFRVFVWAVAAAGVNGVFSKALLACGGQRLYLVVVASQLCACLAATAALAPTMGAVGAAMAMVLGEAIGLPGYYLTYRWAVRRP